MIRNCPQCSKIIEYKSQNSYNRAIRNNSLCKSCTTKNVWTTPGYRSRVKSKLKENWDNDDVRKNQSIKSKKYWQDPEYREKITKSMKKAWSDKEKISYRLLNRHDIVSEDIMNELEN